ncbi:shikimate kinase [Cylindrospermopsis raciborskii S07]|uniref:Shikimate kinase n=2 Tax=Cylindrospermopsis raciborskii TaxID=77022 RepID=A0A853MDU5_9CYAN|nr:shikimate kinase [Cylindrospermopsis raciborskii]EFA69535.1 Shikimate kinase [Cylindrospermopsis raciborskii CS-505]MEB3144720.1 shikimate kinase [Cylindrospermopsis raciborskii]OBU76712.1 shikimate kinase [Cylindrospermopsis raciborskii CS-505]OHY37347.1 shikimate kinase [Cylindrospermopsis raciborskii CS-508]PNJ96296.1 shikimate kinase [Cylindrospermopsis raciborskii C03]
MDGSIKQLLKGVNLYLIGMMGSGKTTIGNLLAQAVNYSFIDTDEVIVKAAGKPISDIFITEGEPAFRQLESNVLAQVCAYTKLTIATGGGIVLRRENWSYLHHGLIIWLDVPVEILLERLKEDQTRPLLQDPDTQNKLRSLLDERYSLYSQADLHIEITQQETPEQTVTNILQAIPGVLKTPVEKFQN